MDQATKLRKIVKKVVKKEEKKIVRPNAQVITVTSGKGGVGKTNFTINLAVQLANEGKKVVILDADFGLANIEVLFGIVPKYTLLDVINGSKIITDILIDGPNGIKFISGGSGIQELTRLNEKQLNYFIQNLSLLDKMADVILIDTGAGVSDTVLTFVKTADEVVLIATPDPTSVTDAYALIKILKSKHDEEVKKEKNKNEDDTDKVKDGEKSEDEKTDQEEIKPIRNDLKLVVNNIRNKEEGEEIADKLKNVSEKFLELDLEVIGYIPHDEMLQKAVKMQQPVSIAYPKSSSSKAVAEISKHFVKEDEDKSYTGIASFIKKFIFKMSN
ncbi:MAG: MinD/ParA family protein [Clostridia bacterium]|jgi:flagellar biosynthesis protein FlhG|nr:MinD/ParA family protein [Clostridia bacterium]